MTCAACGALTCERHRRDEVCEKCDRLLGAYVGKKRLGGLLATFAVLIAFGLAAFAWPPLGLAVFVVVPGAAIVSTRLENRYYRARWLRDAKRGALPPKRGPDRDGPEA
jgi:hypothetical protein